MCLSTRYFIDNIENLVGYCKQCELHIMVTNDGAKITHVFTRNLTTTTASWESTWSIRDTRSDLGLVLEPNTNDNNMIKHLFSVGLSVGKKHYTNLFPLTVLTENLFFVKHNSMNWATDYDCTHVDSRSCDSTLFGLTHV